MSNVGGVSVLAALIVQEIRARQRTSEASSAVRRNAVGRGVAQRRAPAASQLTVQHRIAARLGTIEAADPDRISKGLRIFLEAVLLEEFGSDLVEDPAFHDLLAAVHASMLSSEQLAEPIRAAMSDLLK